MRRRLGSSIALLCAAVLAAVALVLPAAGADGERRVALDIQVAIRDADRCGEWRQDLPTLVAATGIQPGGRTSEVEVCVRNRGNEAGRLTLAVLERVETETSCAGDEASVDSTCAASALGELGGRLAVVAARQDRCRGPFAAAVTRAFVALETTPLILEPALKANQTDCVTLRIEYPSVAQEVAAAAQTDAVSWRYAFDLSN